MNIGETAQIWNIFQLIFTELTLIYAGKLTYSTQKAHSLLHFN